MEGGLLAKTPQVGHIYILAIGEDVLGGSVLAARVARPPRRRSERAARFPGGEAADQRGRTALRPSNPKNRPLLASISQTLEATA